jgi:hypothetical protein
LKYVVYRLLTVCKKRDENAKRNGVNTVGSFTMVASIGCKPVYGRDAVEYYPVLFRVFVDCDIKIVNSNNEKINDAEFPLYPEVYIQ